jgi:hypothetical protein
MRIEYADEIREYLAATCLRFLCGPGARYISGKAIHANGGLISAHSAWLARGFRTRLPDKCARLPGLLMLIVPL